jgi:hypothetical protein
MNYLKILTSRLKYFNLNNSIFGYYFFLIFKINKKNYLNDFFFLFFFFFTKIIIKEKLIKIKIQFIIQNNLCYHIKGYFKLYSLKITFI